MSCDVVGAFAEDFFAAITLEATLDCHDVMGGTARQRVAGMRLLRRGRGLPDSEDE